MLKGKDPLALYNHTRKSSNKKQRTIMVKTSNFYPEVERVIYEDETSTFVQEFNKVNNERRESKKSSASIALLAFIIIIALAAAALGIAYIIVF